MAVTASAWESPAKLSGGTVTLPVLEPTSQE